MRAHRVLSYYQLSMVQVKSRRFVVERLFVKCHATKEKWFIYVRVAYG